MLAVHGAGGFALQMLDTFEALADVCFVDRGEPRTIGSIPVVQECPENAEHCIAIAGPNVRKRIASELSGFRTVIAKTAICSPHASVGDGSIIAHHALIEAHAKVGRHFHANIYSYVAHECVIGDFVTFAPRVSCNGAVTIGDGVYIGTGAMIKQGVTIGEGATIGMGAVVIRDVPPGATVYGNPAHKG